MRALVLIPLAAVSLLLASACDSSSGGTPTTTSASPSISTAAGTTAPADPSEQMSRDLAILHMASLASDLTDDVYQGISLIPGFVDRVTAQCAVLARGAADADQQAAQGFSTPDHPLTAAEGHHINVDLRQFCG
jgi:hypothetical protein